MTDSPFFLHTISTFQSHLMARDDSNQTVDYDPKDVPFNITTSSGGVVTVTMHVVEYYSRYLVNYSISRGLQTGMLAMTLMALIFFSPKDRILKKNIVIQIITLCVAIVKSVLLLRWATSGWGSMYSIITGDYSNLKASDSNNQIVLSVASILLILLVELMLLLHSWTIFRMWRPIIKYICLVLSVFLGFSTVAVRTAYQAMGLKSVLDVAANKSSSEDSDLLLVTVFFFSNLALAISTVWFTVIFNVKLISHMWKTKRLLPSRKGMTPMEILTVTNGFLMIAPVVFVCLSSSKFSHVADFATWTTTAIPMILPFGSLIAQRLISGQKVSSLVHISAVSSNSSNTPTLPLFNGGQDLTMTAATNKTMVETGATGEFPDDRDDCVNIHRDVDQRSERRLAQN